MKLTRDNYEIWFLEYSDGKLDQSQIDAVHRFIAVNPDLAGELDTLTPVLSKNHLQPFPGKDGLKKSLYEDPAHLENSILASLEGDLSGMEQEMLDRWISDKPDQLELFQRFKQARIKPNPHIRYPRKAQLKRKSIVHANWIWISSIAALFLLALFIFQPGDKKKELATTVEMSKSNTPKTSTSAGIAETTHNRASDEPEKLIAATKPSSGTLVHLSKNQTKNLPPIFTELRRSDTVALLLPKTGEVKSDFLLFADLAPIREPMAGYSLSGEISLADYLKKKYEALKADEPKLIITREEIVVAGLHLFSKLPGRRLTGRRDAEGNLRSISFNSQLLAFSIPLNR